MNIKDKLYKHQHEKERTVYDPTDVTFAPSYLADCKRKIYFKKTNTEQTNPPDLPAIFKMELGKAGHEKIQNMITELGLMVECEVHKESWHSGVKYNYFIDGIIKDGEKKAIFEIKTIYGAGFRFVEKEPKKEHVMQAVCYMFFENIQDAILLYVGRDNGFMVQYDLHLGNEGKFTINGDSKYQEWRNETGLLIAEEMPKLKKMIEAGQCPGRDFNISLKNNKGDVYDNFQKEGQKYKSDWQCSYCGYKDKCWSKELEEIKKHRFYINGEFID